MLVDDKVLQYVATNVLDDMLGLKVAPLDRSGQSIDDLIASIRISGDWNAGLEVSTSARGADSIAQKFFGQSKDGLSELEISDALGEIANMIGGNIKGMCWGETRLSIPVVRPASQTATRPLIGTTVKTRMKVGEDVLSIIVLHTES